MDLLLIFASFATTEYMRLVSVKTGPRLLIAEDICFVAPMFQRALHFSRLFEDLG